MAVKIAHAGSNEWGGTHGGEAGNQRRTPGKLDGELQVSDWYNKPWKICLRPKDPKKAEIIANTALGCVKNAKIGYDQNERQTLYYQLKANGWDPAKVGYCETDCSSLWCACANAAGISVDPVCWTGIMEDLARKSGAFEVLTDSKYITTDKFLKRGDALVKPGAHAVIVIENGSEVGPDPTPDPFDKVYQTTGSVWMRKGPGITYSKIKSITIGVQIQVSKIEGNWAYAKDGNDIGYVSMKYLEKAIDTVNPVTLVTTGSLWLRKDPGMSGKQLIVIPANTRLQCNGATKTVSGTTWYQVAYNGYTGWSSGVYLKPVKEIKFKTTGKLNMRKGATTSSAVIQVVDVNQLVISNGEYITAGGVRWYYCTYKGKSGYMSNMYLKEI